MSALGIPEGRRRPSVVTGLGVIAPTGLDVRRHWDAVLAGKSGLGRITRFDPTSYPVKVAGEVPGFEADEHIPGILVSRTDRFTHFALAAAEAALADAQADPARMPEYEMAVVTASSSGGTEFGQGEMERLYQNGPAWVGAFQSIAWFYAATTGQVSIRQGMRGPCGVICAEQAGGLDALGQSRRLLDTGSRLVLSGGTDASLCPYGLTAQLSTRALSTVDDPTRAYLPFDESADGYVPGEGGAMLVVETEDGARERGIGHYGRILGYASGFDPAPGSGRRPALTSVVRRALADADVTAEDIDVVFADAAGVPEADRAEADAINTVFGRGRVPVTAPKTLTGRLYAGGAALDVATALLSLTAGTIPHTAGSGSGDHLGIDLVVERPRRATLRTALVLARGHGGFTSALVLGAGDRTGPLT
ncbi:ketosynthase chain-length factor [Streptomyces sp. NPDC090119]|uniref:ketosynthase chain-length factor n=1 Tax=Streptomyces sp. NPDC090119 TaxID=3365951 RepID=UPI00381F9D0E